MKGKKLSYKERIDKLEADKTERKRIFRELCAHVEKGYSLDCFVPLSVNSIRRYINVFKDEFIQEELDEAMRQGKVYWETIGDKQANGQCLGNSRSWYYNMANRYGWRDKIDIEAEHKGQLAVNIVSYSSKKPLQCAEDEE